MNFKTRQSLQEDSVVQAAKAYANKTDSDIVYDEDSLEAALDDAYKANMRNKKLEARGQEPGVWNNILLAGEAGVGKTARVKQWIKSKPNLRLYIKDAKGMDPADIGGAVAPDKETGKRAIKLSSDEFNDLDFRPDDDRYVVLFLDELNRAAADVRGSLLTLINDHEVPDADVVGGERYLPGLLFTVAAINPGGGDYNVDDLDAAERSRFSMVTVTADNRATLRFLLSKYDKQLELEDDEDEMLEIEGRKAIAKKLLNDPTFRFDDSEEIAQAQETQTNILNPRSLEQCLSICDGTKKSFLKWWDRTCNPTKKGIIENILHDYKDIDNKANSVFKTGQGRLNGKAAEAGQADASIFKKKEPSAFDKFAKYKADNGIAFETK